MSAVKSEPSRTRELGDTKRRIVDRLKRAESTPGELATALGLTEAAVRQHLDALADERARHRDDATTRGARPARDTCGRSPISRATSSPTITTISPSISSMRSGAHSARTGCRR